MWVGRRPARPQCEVGVRIAGWPALVDDPDGIRLAAHLRRLTSQSAPDQVDAENSERAALVAEHLSGDMLLASYRHDVTARRRGPGRSSGRLPPRAGAGRTACGPPPAAPGRRRACHTTAAHRQPLMLGDERRHRGQLDLLAPTDDLSRQIRRQGISAAGALIRAVGDDHVGIGAERAAVPLVARLGAAGLGLLAPLLAIGRGRLGGGARGLLGPLQPQHQLDQLLLAQALKIAATHLTRESAK